MFIFCVFVWVLESECDLFISKCGSDVVICMRCVCVCVCACVCLQVATLSLNPRLTKVECCNPHQI